MIFKSIDSLNMSGWYCDFSRRTSGHVRRMKKDYLKQFWNGVNLEEEEEKEDSKFVSAGSNNWNEKEGN